MMKTERIVLNDELVVESGRPADRLMEEK